jgi:ribosome-binding protein aMBF1 (putative translation factor)
MKMTQKELNNVLTNKVVEQSNQIISMQILLYSLVDLVIEKELISKEDLEEMIDNKKTIVEQWLSSELKPNTKDDSAFMMHYGKPGEA